MFEKKKTTLDNVSVEEYGIYCLTEFRWACFGEDDYLRLHVEARSLRPEGEPVTEFEAQGVLEWAKSGIPDVQGRKCSIPPHVLDNCVVFPYTTLRAVVVETSIEINILNSSDVLFDLRGPNEDVEKWLMRYRRDFPDEVYDTAVYPQRQFEDAKHVRVHRKRVPRILA